VAVFLDWPAEIEVKSVVPGDCDGIRPSAQELLFVGAITKDSFGPHNQLVAASAESRFLGTPKQMIFECDLEGMILRGALVSLT
jgi:hypothetical protein